MKLGLKIKRYYDYRKQEEDCTINLEMVMAVSKWSRYSDETGYSYSVGHYILYTYPGCTFYERFNTVKEQDDRYRRIMSIIENNNGTIFTD